MTNCDEKARAQIAETCVPEIFLEVSPVLEKFLMVQFPFLYVS
jgi:hypothetical protein